MQYDVLMWLMNEAKGVERSLEGLTRRILLINFASIHSTCLVGVTVHMPFPLSQTAF
jgi:hypothetical protein